jgi:hypothetical protein
MPSTMCTSCGAVFPLPDYLIGKRVKCKTCKTAFDAHSLEESIASSLPASLPPPLPGSDMPVASEKPGDKWYYNQNKKKKGPVSLSQLRRLQSEGVLDPEDLVLQEGTKKWRPLAAVTGAESGIKHAPGGKHAPESKVPTVFASRSDSPATVGRRLHFGWLIGAFAALIVPILTASALTIWRSPAREVKPRLAYAGIEIGSNGPRYCVVEFPSVPNPEENFQVVASETTTARIGTGMDASGKFDQAEFRKMVAGVQTFYERLTNKHGLPAEQIVIVSGEGLFDPIARRKDLDAQEKKRRIDQCREELSAAVKQVTGQTIEFVNAARFAEHEIRAVVRKSDLKDAVFLDIGGGSTRGTYCDAAEVIQTAKGPGIQSFMGHVNDGLSEDDKFAERAAALAEQHLREPFRQELGKDPEFTARRKIYLAGGIAWVMAYCQHPGETNDYVRLNAADIEEFTTKVRATPDLLTKIRPDSSLPAERQEWLTKEYARMRNAFKAPERLVAGAEILLALSTELQFARREIWFYRHSDFAWVASYIEETRCPRK